MTFEDLFLSRPFKIRNADEYDPSSILSLFVSPTDGLSTPFDFENIIVKGRMGSGKTMYLRANHAYYISSLVPTLMSSGSELILPVLIRLSDFQHITRPEDVYRAIIIKIIEELCSIYLQLEDMKGLAELQAGLRYLPDHALRAHKFAHSMKQLAALGSEEYIERVTSELGFKGGVKPRFLELSAEFKRTNFAEIKKKPNPGIKDVEECYKNLLEDQEGKILLLIDEAGSLDKSFFKSADGSQCFFEILMNQFRTAQFIRTKIAVYPNSYSDVLTETRYGDTVYLEESVASDDGYSRFRRRAIAIIESYLNARPYEDTSFKATDVFEIEAEAGDGLEQLMYASSGNYRRLIQLFDLAMDAAFRVAGAPAKVTKESALVALRGHAESSQTSFAAGDSDFIENLVAVCKARGTFKFQLPYVSLYKYTGRSQEYNIIAVDQLGSGRRATVYAFDYAFCVLKDVPTHRMLDSERINRERTREDGRWLTRVATISQEIMEHASLPGKVEGNIDFMHGDVGFIKDDSGGKFFYKASQVLDSDRKKPMMMGTRVRFLPVNVGDDSQMAIALEILS